MIEQTQKITIDASLSESIEDSIDLEKRNDEIKGNDITLDHTPILSNDMKIFSHIYEHKEHHSQKNKNKIKSFISYFAGGVSILALSIFGFISGPPSSIHLSANILNPQEISQKFLNKKDCISGPPSSIHLSANILNSQEISQKFLNKEDCISDFIKKSTPATLPEEFKKQEKLCQEVF